MSEVDRLAKKYSIPLISDEIQAGLAALENGGYRAIWHPTGYYYGGQTSPGGRYLGKKLPVSTAGVPNLQYVG